MVQLPWITQLLAQAGHQLGVYSASSLVDCRGGTCRGTGSLGSSPLASIPLVGQVWQQHASTISSSKLKVGNCWLETTTVLDWLLRASQDSGSSGRLRQVMLAVQLWVQLVPQALSGCYIRTNWCCRGNQCLLAVCLAPSAPATTGLQSTSSVPCAGMAAGQPSGGRAPFHDLPPRTTPFQVICPACSSCTSCRASTRCAGLARSKEWWIATGPAGLAGTFWAGAAALGLPAAVLSASHTLLST